MGILWVFAAWCRHRQFQELLPLSVVAACTRWTLPVPPSVTLRSVARSQRRHPWAAPPAGRALGVCVDPPLRALRTDGGGGRRPPHHVGTHRLPWWGGSQLKSISFCVFWGLSVQQQGPHFSGSQLNSMALFIFRGAALNSKAHHLIDC